MSLKSKKTSKLMKKPSKKTVRKVRVRKARKSRRHQKGGMAPIEGDNIPLMLDTSPDWHDKGSDKPSIAVDSSFGINEYQFGRTMPDGNFVVATNVEQTKKNLNLANSLKMTGGRRRKSRKSSKKSSGKSTISAILSSIDSFITSIGKSIFGTSSKKSKKSKKTKQVKIVRKKKRTPKRASLSLFSKKNMNK